MKNVFIIGSKGIPAKYGGFETFVEKLTENKKSKKIKYHVACIGENNEEFEYNNARCFKVSVPDIGPAKAVLYDLYALKQVINYIRTNNLKGSIVYILACRIGPFINHYKKQLHKLDCLLYVNSDGHEWKRAKWNAFIKKYWKLSERLMIKNCDLAICDSMYKTNKLEKNNYYLIVGRFVPENNFEIMIREFMNSNSKRDLVIITNLENNKYYDNLKKNTDFEKDTRIKFVGTVYDQELLKAIRINAFAYIHGHSVGGTNPSLLEAMATTNINLLLNVDFNIEVGDSTAIYWGKQLNSLTDIINNVETFSNEYIQKLGNEAKQIIKQRYSWDLIINKYENLFLNKVK